MLPAFTLLLAFELSSAMRVLFTIAIVLASLSRRDVRETGVESVLSAVLAGALAVAFSLLYTFWPEPGAALLLMAFLGLLAVPYAFEGPHRGAVALAFPLVWLLLGTAEGSPVSRTLEWSLYSVAGVFYAVGARALLLAMLRLATGAEGPHGMRRLPAILETGQWTEEARPAVARRRTAESAALPRAGPARPERASAEAAGPPGMTVARNPRAPAWSGAAYASAKRAGMARADVACPLRQIREVNAAPLCSLPVEGPDSVHPPNDWSRLRFSLRRARELRHFCRRSLSRSPPGFLP